MRSTTAITSCWLTSAKTRLRALTPRGIQLESGSEHELDVIIFATGYDAVTGPLNLIHIEGIGGEVLKEKFANGPRTYMGMSSYGFPNIFTINGRLRGQLPPVRGAAGGVGHRRHGPRPGQRAPAHHGDPRGRGGVGAAHEG